MEAINCLPGSAWHTWQNAGERWRSENPTADATPAAESFACEPGHPRQSSLLTAPADYAARYRAFLQGAAARLCDYCESAPATGYVGAYAAHVCEACYEDHHGPL